ncbi:methylenetetrahydrofolate reductase [NAD(P)H] [Marivibrio halodurans]|uniref:Methylenetetrahydrofolate reductase n=1 Tax=Marivibrio halodurans TaxID=2039722 RepID=A0A8J7V363_9PROT|nr:methylenetetrahydrofolate reductase [NAD(P)H] [Marivibrio halodurans]MBP5856489.1 methylenetetrahydrofolate reductase [NAD(P)H] [Marivibrio halodurans]
MPTNLAEKRTAARGAGRTARGGAGPRVSFEFFPPKTDKAGASLEEAIRGLAPLAPQFMTVTYGAGGSTQSVTRQWVDRVAELGGTPVGHHLTCVGATRAEIDALARSLWNDGIRHIVALRGDPPQGTTRYEPHPDGYAFAADLVEGLRRVADFEISVGAYPEVHPEAASAAADMDNLKRKLDAGATRAITQYFFDVETFLRFRDRAHAAGITKEIVPGIIPVTNIESLIRFSEACGATVPRWLTDLFDGLQEDPETRQMIAASVAIEQCTRLQAEGADSFHFYTLNRANVTRAVCHALGVRASADKVAA